MTYEEFIPLYFRTVKRAFQLLVFSREEGILSLEDRMDYSAYSKRDIFEFGLRLTIDGTDWEFTDRILSNLITLEKDDYSRLLDEIKKESVRCIYKGCNGRILLYLLNSLVKIENDPLTNWLFVPDNPIENPLEVLDLAISKYSTTQKDENGQVLKSNIKIS